MIQGYHIIDIIFRPLISMITLILQRYFMPPLEIHSISRAEENLATTNSFDVVIIGNEWYYHWQDHWTSLLAVTILPVNKMPVGDGKGVLTSPSISPPGVQQKNLKLLYRKLRGYLILWFNKYLQNPWNLLSLKLISPTVWLIGSFQKCGWNCELHKWNNVAKVL